MVVSLGRGDQLGDIVVAEAPAEAHGARLGSIGLRRGRSENLVQTNAQRRIDHFFERFAQFGRALLRFGGNVRIQG